MPDIQKVTDPQKIVTDPVLLSALAEQGQFWHFTEADLAYAAGIIDGEGTIFINRQKRHTNRPEFKNPCYYLQVTVCMCEPTVPQWLYLKFGGSYKQYPPRNIKWKDTYHWRLGERKAVNLLIALLPYLKTKAKQAEIAIEFGGLKRGRGIYWSQSKPRVTLEAEKILRNKMMELNHRGSNV